MVSLASSPSTSSSCLDDLGIVLLSLWYSGIPPDVSPRSLLLGAIPLLLHRPFSLLVLFDAQQLFFPYLEFNISEFRCIHHFCLQMLLDDYCQITSPCLLVFFGNKWRSLLSIEGVPGERLEVEMPEEGFVLWVVWFHNSYLFKISIVNLAKQRWQFCIYLWLKISSFTFCSVRCRHLAICAIWLLE